MILAQTDEHAFEKLAADFKRHNIHVAYHTTGRFITESDDEWSVVLLAFYEAVKNYDPDRGAFSAFADTVLRSRLIDYMRKQSRHSCEISVDIPSLDSSSTEDDLHISEKSARLKLIDSARQQETQTDLRFEVDALSNTLNAYGIAFSDLPGSSPKAKKSKRSCRMVIRYILGSDDIYAEMKHTHTLPVKKIIEICKVPRKIPERHRKYIITVVEILRGDYPCLSEYFQWIKEEEEQ